MPNHTIRQIEIIRTALELIAAQGIQKLTLKNLAAEIGISEPAIYRHFKNKLKILEAVLDHFTNENKLFFSEVVASKTGAVEKIESIFLHHFEVFKRQPALAAVLFSEEIFQNERRLANKILETMTQRQEAMIRIITSPDTSSVLRTDMAARHLAMIIMGSLRLIVNKWHISRYSFDLIKEGDLLWKALKKVITKPL